MSILSNIKNVFASISTKKVLAFLGFALFAGAAAASNATGGIGGTQVGTLLTDIVGVIEGPLGQIVIILSFVWGIFKVLEQDWIQVFGAFLGGLVLINIGSIVDDIFSASTAEAVVTHVQNAAPVLSQLAL